MRRGFFLLSAIAGLSGPVFARDAGETTLLIAQLPIALDDSAENISSHADLRVAGAWELTSADRRFGGISGMAVDQGRVTLLSDSGLLFHLSGFEGAATVTRLPGACANADKKKAGDSESIAATPDGSGWRIGLERTNTLCAFASDQPDAGALSAPAAFSGWPRNRGAEAMASLSGAGMAVIGESTLEDAQTRPLLWYHGDIAQAETPLTAMRYQPPKGYKPSDAAFLPDGRMLVLNRRYRLGAGRSSVLALVPAFTPQAGVILDGLVIAALSALPVAGNYEAMAVETHAKGSTIWLVTDNNHARAAKTLLVRLELGARAGGVQSAGAQ